MLIDVYSPNGTYDAKFLANYAYINLTDPILRSPGIGNVQVFGAGQYAMRLWVKPDQLAKLGITVPEIISAIQAQNTVNPAGKVGGEPAPKGQEFTHAVLAQGRLVSPEEFGQIVVRETPDGGTVRVRDVARIELGSQDYSVAGRFNGKPSAVVAMYQLPGSNAVQAAAGVNKLMAKLSQRFPQDLGFCGGAGYHARGHRGNEGDRHDAGDRAHSGDFGGVPISAELALDVDSVAGGSGFADWHVCVFPAVRIFDQYAFAVWPGAGDWARGR